MNGTQPVRLFLIGLSGVAIGYLGWTAYRTDASGAHTSVFPQTHSTSADLAKAGSASQGFLKGGHTTAYNQYGNWRVFPRPGSGAISFEVTEHVPQDQSDPLWQVISAQYASGEPLPDAGSYRGSWSYRLGYAVEVVSQRGSHDFVLAGKRRLANGNSLEGSAVIERWVLTPGDGAVRVSRPEVAAPIGAPAMYSAASMELVGNQYVPADQREAPAESRLLLYSGNGLGEVSDLAFDPEGRFVLTVSDATDQVFQLSADGSGDFQEILGPDAHPFLSVVRYIRAIEHVDLGRVYILSSDYSTHTREHLVLRDLDGDGMILDDVVHLQGEDWDNSTYPDRSKWRDDFVAAMVDWP